MTTASFAALFFFPVRVMVTECPFSFIPPRHPSGIRRDFGAAVVDVCGEGDFPCMMMNATVVYRKIVPFCKVTAACVGAPTLTNRSDSRFFGKWKNKGGSAEDGPSGAYSGSGR